MKLSFGSLFVGAMAISLALGAQLPLKRTSKPRLQRRNGFDNFRINAVLSDDSALSLDTVHDLIYMAEMTLGDNVYTVQLDTGSSDLWIKADTYPLPNAELTTITYNVTYGIGWANGTIGYASAQFANISVDRQAFLDTSNAQNPALGYGANGILGLGFTSLSTVDKLVNDTGSSDGRSLLYNLFEDNPSEPNFISFALHRSTEEDDEVEGTFTLGEYVEEYKDVQYEKAISTFPVNSPKRWNVLLEAAIIGDKIFTPTTKIPDAPSNRAVVLLDSGTSYSYTSVEMASAIYGSISGAAYDSSLGQWRVPCDAEIDMALQFGGKVYPLHPLDVTPNGLTDSSSCVGSFVPQSVAVGAGSFDMIMGDNVLRSMYSVYDFGDFDSDGKMGSPYVKLLSIIDPDEASADFAQARGTTPRTNITYNASNESEAEAGSTSVTLSTDVAKTIDQMGKYLPAILGVMALNALILVALVVVGIVYLCRRRKSKKTRVRTPAGRLSPMPRNSYIAGNDPEQHVYEPVSMAITDDTLLPPRGLHSFEGSLLRPGDRPKSMANLPSHHYKRLDSVTSEDQIFSPPKASFQMGDGRPKSVGLLPSQMTMHSPTGKGVGEDEPFIPPAIELHDADGNGKAKAVDEQPVNVAFPRQSSADESLSPQSPSVRSFHQSQGSIHSIHSARSSVVPPGNGSTSSLATPPRRPTYPPPPVPPEDAHFTSLPPSPTRSLHQQDSSDNSLHPNSGSNLSPGGDRSRAVTFTDRPQGVTLRDRPPGVSLTDRPHSALVPHTQDPVFSPPTPVFRGSPLRGNASGDRPMSAFLPSQGPPPRSPYRPQQTPLSAPAEDDGTFQPPTPAFRANGQGSSLRPGAGQGGDRPMSIA